MQNNQVPVQPTPQLDMNSVRQNYMMALQNYLQAIKQYQELTGGDPNSTGWMDGDVARIHNAVAPYREATINYQPMNLEKGVMPQQPAPMKQAANTHAPFNLDKPVQKKLADELWGVENR